MPIHHHEALKKAEAFIEGFAGDDAQEGIDELLADIRTALAESASDAASVVLASQPMDTAPKDQVIFTNEGLVIYVDPNQWGSPVTRGWYTCTLDGDITSCAEDGMSISLVQPKYWSPAPQITRPDEMPG